MVNRLRGRRHSLVRRTLIAQRPLCPDCASEGQTRLGVEMDHRVPMHLGGNNSLANLQMLCADHHRAKTALEMDVLHDRVRGCNAQGEPNSAHDAWCASTTEDELQNSAVVCLAG